ncbi:MAG: aldo/keto reductase [Caldilineaceae bacterium]
MVLFTLALARRLDGTGVTANVLHPGIVKTALSHDYMANPVFRFFEQLIAVSPAQGAQTSIFLASSSAVANVSGQYFEKQRAEPLHEVAQDQAQQERLWDVSMMLTDLHEMAGSMNRLSRHSGRANCPLPPICGTMEAECSSPIPASRRATQKGATHGFPLLGKTGLRGQRTLPGRDDLRPRSATKRTATRCSTASWTRAAISSTRPTSTARARPETILGTWLKQRPRDELVIATKVRFPMSDGPNDVGLSRKHILSSVESSLRRLQTDYIDLYQVHSWDHRTPLEETLSTLDGLVKAGKVRYLGVSNYTGWQLQKAIDLSKARGWEPFASLQPLYNLLDRSTEWELVPVCQNEGLGIIPWSPLRGGWLTGTPPGDGGAAHRHAHREGRAPGVERIVARVRQRAHVEHHRHAAGHRRRDGQIRGPGRAQLGAQPAGDHGAHHRRTHVGATGRQPGRGRLGAERRADGAAHRGQRAGVALSLRHHPQPGHPPVTDVTAAARAPVQCARPRAQNRRPFLT